MRIGSMQMTTRYLTQLNRTYENQTKLMEQSDGAKMHRPSDDAVGYSKYLRYSVSYGENEQYQTNLKTAISWMRNSDSALVDMAACFATIVEKSNEAQGTNTFSDMKAIGSEMLVQVQQAVADANSQVGGRYLFSGQADLIQPFTMSADYHERGRTKTLDDNQKAFFNDTTVSGDMAQMLVLNGDDGEEYYLNTLTGDLYDKEFMDEGYKNLVASGMQDHVDPTKDAVANISSQFTGVSDYFETNGIGKWTGANPTLTTTPSFTATVNGNTVNFEFATVTQLLVSYIGDRKEFSMVKENGAVQPASDTVNATGIDISGYSIFDNPDSGNEYSGTNAFNDALTIIAMVNSGNDRWMSSDGKTLANNAFETINTAETKLAARQQVYTDCQEMLSTQNYNILNDITDIHSTDVAKLSVEWMEAQTIYNLSLSVGGRILPPTLADYL